MSILIKGMEMPRYCYECKVWFECFEEKPHFNLIKSICPLVEVKEPHGRLIDIKSVEDGKFVTVGNDYQRWWNGALDSVIDNAPTVIEAEGSETDA